MIRQMDVTCLNDELKHSQQALADSNIWDVRDHNAYIEGHIAGAVSRPVNQGYARQQVVETIGTIYVLCGGGSKAPRAAQLLDDIDDKRDIVILTGGTRGAMAAGMQIIQGSSPL